MDLNEGGGVPKYFNLGGGEGMPYFNFAME